MNHFGHAAPYDDSLRVLLRKGIAAYSQADRGDIGQSRAVQGREDDEREIAGGYSGCQQAGDLIGAVRALNTLPMRLR